MNSLLNKINDIFIKLGFVTIIIDGKNFLKYNNSYYLVSYIRDLDAFIIEFAENIEAVEKNLFEDSDIYPMSLGEKRILEIIEEDLKKFYLK